MLFRGISKTFSTKGTQQFNKIGEFWDELSLKYGRQHLCGLGYNWTENTIEYVIGLKEGIIDGANCSVELPDVNWIKVRGKTSELDKIYEKIYLDGTLKYEIETFTDDDKCEILYYR